MALLDDVLIAHGGMDRWMQVRRFTMHMSIDGALLLEKGKGGALRDIVVEGNTQEQKLHITGFGAPDRCALFRPDRVAVESLSGEVLQWRDNPKAAFANHAEFAPWDDLHLAYYCGYSVWNYATAPFLFAGPGFHIEEMAPWQEDGETWFRLKVTFPPEITTHSVEQILSFNRDRLQRRMDYRADAEGGGAIAQYSRAHQSFSGIVVPTLRRTMRIGPDGKAIEKPAYANIEIFDAKFE